MTEDQRPRILITNDDGIDAPGIWTLAEALAPEHELLIVAPDRERSATGHAITILKEMKLDRFYRDGDHVAWSFQGKPADCVKIGVTEIWKGRKIDLVVAGINRGQNLGVNILYSGTVAGAREGVILGIPSIAFSLQYTDVNNVDFTAAGKVAGEITRRVLNHGMPDDVLLNVNVPPIPFEEIGGYAITRQGDSGFRDQFVHVDGHPEEDRQVRNIGANFERSRKDDEDLDDHAMSRNLVSITPLHVDSTAHHHIEALQGVFEI